MGCGGTGSPDGFPDRPQPISLLDCKNPKARLVGKKMLEANFSNPSLRSETKAGSMYPGLLRQATTYKVVFAPDEKTQEFHRLVSGGLTLYQTKNPNKFLIWVEEKRCVMEIPSRGMS